MRINYINNTRHILKLFNDFRKENDDKSVQSILTIKNIKDQVILMQEEIS